MTQLNRFLTICFAFATIYCFANGDSDSDSGTFQNFDVVSKPAISAECEQLQNTTLNMTNACPYALRSTIKLSIADIHNLTEVIQCVFCELMACDIFSAKYKECQENETGTDLYPGVLLCGVETLECVWKSIKDTCPNYFSEQTCQLRGVFRTSPKPN